MSHSLTNPFRRGAENLVRNWTTSIPTILVLAIVLTLTHSLLIVHDRAESIIASLQEKLSVTVYLKDSADSFEVSSLITTLEKRDDVIKPVSYISKQEAWRLLGNSFSLDNELLEKYGFSLPASITIIPKTPEAVQHIEKFLDGSAKNLLREPLSSGDSRKNVTTSMVNFIRQVKGATVSTLLFFAVIFSIGGLLMISSAIHLAITSRSREITIMKFIGASPGSIAAPFVVEGFFMSVAAFLLNLLFISILPFESAHMRLTLNALIIEAFAIFIFCTGISYLAALLHIREKRLM